MDQNLPFSSGYDQKIGSEKDILDLETFIAKINTIPQENFGEEITKYLDVKKYLIWLCGAVCTQNYDGFIHNYALYRNSENGIVRDDSLGLRCNLGERLGWRNNGIRLCPRSRL